MLSRVMTTKQAEQAGFSEYVIHARVLAGKWQRMFRGVYFTEPGPPTFHDWCTAALLYAGRDARLWAATAARLHGLDGFTPAPGAATVTLPIVVAVPHLRDVESQPNVVVKRLRRIPEEDFASRSGHPCSTAVRAVIELSEYATPRQLLLAFEDLHRQGKHEELAERIDELRRGRGFLGPLEELMSRRGPNAVATESAAEAICDDILWTGGLRAERQFKVQFGSTKRRIDLAFPGLMLGIECDSRAWHTAANAFEQDRARWAWLAARGWQLIHFTWKQLDDPPYVLETVRAAMRARSVLRVG